MLDLKNRVETGRGNKMRCPYCQEEMRPGYIPNGEQPVQWIPNGERPSHISFSVAETGVALINQFKPLQANGYRAEAHYCPKCGIAIAPTSK